MKAANDNNLAMVVSEQKVRFRCACGKGLKAKFTAIGRRYPCPACHQQIVVPAPTMAAAKAEPVPLAAQPVAPATGVPLTITLPQKLGGGTLATQVSKRTADDIPKYVIGGLLVALGVGLVLLFPPLAPAVVLAGAKRWRS